MKYRILGFQWGGETGNRRQGGTEHRVLAEVWRYRGDKSEGGETAGEGTEGEVEGRAGTGDRQIFPHCRKNTTVKNSF